MFGKIASRARQKPCSAWSCGDSVGHQDPDLLPDGVEIGGQIAGEGGAGVETLLTGLLGEPSLRGVVVALHIGGHGIGLAAGGEVVPAVPLEEVGGGEVVDKMIAAYAFAAADPYRAATNNKGIMNGIIPVVIATGNDTRAIESGAHAYAARSGQYSPFATWEKNADGDLVGSIEMPMAVGLVGGATKIHPAAKVAVKMLGVKTAGELAQIIAAVGLAQNMAAMRALATEGIQRGHMSLHARNLAATAGATGELLEKIVKQMVSEKNVRLEYAQELVKQYQK